MTVESLWPSSKISSIERLRMTFTRAQKIFEFHLARWASNSQLLLVRAIYPLAQVFKLINNS